MLKATSEVGSILKMTHEEFNKCTIIVGDNSRYVIALDNGGELLSEVTKDNNVYSIVLLKDVQGMLSTRDEYHVHVRLRAGTAVEESLYLQTLLVHE